jgi:Rrf2 family transcriptional regulator, iron-sulfur cluster assembly transcription factor
MLSRTSKYALRVLVQLGSAKGERPLLRRELADAVGAPSAYLAKILVSLSKAGYLNAARGAGGGYTLAKPADSIVLLPIVELFDGAQAVGTCLFNDDHMCLDVDPARARTPWCEIHRSYLTFLTTTSLASVVSCGWEQLD